ncbi:hypothetical protein V6N12_062565 [Hibiscus sabdariffa]|uniref:Uncharacterized protein n=1 Tax=Hibiscus sabdariffa TaxID=183260 RepID=A0ABR2F9B4_9ROSI
MTLLRNACKILLFKIIQVIEMCQPQMVVRTLQGLMQTLSNLLLKVVAIYLILLWFNHLWVRVPQKLSIMPINNMMDLQLLHMICPLLLLPGNLVGL